MNPKVSILIPVFNREKLLVPCLESALKQNYDNFEIIVVDNCSTDSTWEVLSKYVDIHKNLKIFRNKENLGPVRNWKKCIDRASGKYIKILWSDDWIDKDFLSETVSILEKNEDVAFVYTPTIVHSDKTTNLIYSLGRGKKHSMDKFVNFFCFRWLGYPSSPGNALFRTEDITKNLIIDIPNNLGLNFNRYGAGNDLLFFLRCFPKYKNFYITRKAMSHFYNHEKSITASNDIVIFYLYTVKYFVETYTVADKYKRYFYHGLKVENVLKKNKYKMLTVDHVEYSVLLLLNILIGRIYYFLINSITWILRKK
jgi:glycosyltransferase involved in cell wall biosynthesis